MRLHDGINSHFRWRRRHEILILDGACDFRDFRDLSSKARKNKNFPDHPGTSQIPPFLILRGA